MGHPNGVHADPRDARNRGRSRMVPLGGLAALCEADIIFTSSHLTPRPKATEIAVLPGTGPAFLRVARASRLHSHLLVDQVDTVDTVDVVDGAARATSLWSAPRTQPASTKSSVFSERSRKCRIGIDADQARGSGAPKSKPVRNKRERDLRRAHIESRQGRKKIAHHFSGGNPRLPQTTSPVGTADNSTAEFQNACRGRVPRWRGWFGGSRTGGGFQPHNLGRGMPGLFNPLRGWIVVVRTIPGLRPGRLTLDPVPESPKAGLHRSGASPRSRGSLSPG